MSSTELRDIVLEATREAYPRKPDAVADQVARWFAAAERDEKPVEAKLCAFCRRAAASVWASALADHSVVASREQGSATVGLCADCVAAAAAIRTHGVPPKDDIRRRVVASLEREREHEAIAELNRVLALAPNLRADRKDAVCSICATAVSFKLVAAGRIVVCDGCLAKLQAT